MWSVYSVQNIFIGSLAVWFFWLLYIHLPQDLADRRHAAQFYHFCPSSDPLVPWRAKVRRQSWFTSRPHGSTLVSGTHLVGWGWSSSPTYLCPSKYAEGLNFLLPGSTHRRWNGSLAPSAPASSTVPVKTTPFRIVVTCPPLYLPQIAMGSEVERGQGAIQYSTGFKDFFRPWGERGHQGLFSPLANWATNNENVINCASESVSLLLKIMEIPPKASNCWRCSCEVFCVAFGHFLYSHVYFKDKMEERLLRAEPASGRS